MTTSMVMVIMGMVISMVITKEKSKKLRYTDKYGYQQRRHNADATKTKGIVTIRPAMTKEMGLETENSHE